MWGLIRPLTKGEIIAGRMVLLGLASKEYYHSVTEEEGDYTSDAIATLTYLAAVGVILFPVIKMGVIGRIVMHPAAAAIVIPVLIGGVISYIIDDEEGVEAYTDFMGAAIETSGTSIITRTLGPLPILPGGMSQAEQLGMSEEEAATYTPSAEILLSEIQEAVSHDPETMDETTGLGLIMGIGGQVQRALTLDKPTKAEEKQYEEFERLYR